MKLLISLNQYILIEVRAIENKKELNLSSFIEIDKSIKLPSSYLDGSHLSILFTMTHNESIRGNNYKDLKGSNELGLLKFLVSHKDLEINVNNIIKMYQILSNNKEASFRDSNAIIETGKKFYIPTSKDNIVMEMNKLCESFAYLNSPNKDDFDDIFKFILQFICIHPFSNGNGRLSIFLLELLLSKFGLSNALYLPLDALFAGVYITSTTMEIRKASGFFYKMKEYEYDSYISYMKELVLKAYDLLKRSIK